MPQMPGIRLMVCMIVSIIVIGAFAASGESTRKIVVFQEGTSQQVQQEVIEQSGSHVLHVLSLINGLAIELPPDGTDQALASLRSHPAVEGVYDDPTTSATGEVTAIAQDAGGDHIIFITPAEAPEEEFYPWGLDRIGVPDVHEEQGLTGSGVVVAITDTGIDRDHPELRQNIIGGVNARAGEDPANYQDDNGHGTHVAGIILAAQNRQGVIGAAPRASLYAVKVLDQNGNGYLSDFINGLAWVLAEGLAKGVGVVNMSLSFSEDSPLLEKVTKQLYETGVIMVASAGNRSPGGAQDAGGDDAGGDDAGGDDAGGDATGPCVKPVAQDAGGDDAGGDDAGGDDAGGDNAGCGAPQGGINYPARYPWIIAVAATDIDNKVTDYSRFGPELDLVAPGGSKESEQTRIFSTNLGGGYGLGVGTSYSAAHVTGIVALALQSQPGLSFEEVLALLQHTATDLGYPPTHQGAGLVDAKAMLEALQTQQHDKGADHHGKN